MKRVDFSGFIPVVGFEDQYIVNESGDVYSIPRNGTILDHKKIATSIHRDGYVKIVLSKNNKHHYLMQHRIVALAFIDNPHNKPQVNHIDGDKTNNHVSNLEWCTAKENKAHAVINGLSSDIGKFNKDTKRKLTETQVEEIRVLLKKKTMMQKDIAIKYGVRKQTITNIKKGFTYVL